MTKFARALFMVLALLGGILGTAIILAPSKAMEMGVTDKIMLLTYGVFFLFTTLWAITDAHIKYSEAITDSWKRIHKRSIELSYVALGGCIIMILLVYFQ